MVDVKIFVNYNFVIRMWICDNYRKWVVLLCYSGFFVGLEDFINYVIMELLSKSLRLINLWGFL